MGVGIRPGMVYKSFVLGGELSGLSGYCLGYLAGMGLGTPPVASWGGIKGCSKSCDGSWGDFCLLGGTSCGFPTLGDPHGCNPCFMSEEGLRPLAPRMNVDCTE